MNFKKINKSVRDKYTGDDFTVDDVKMVKVSFIFPVWKNDSFTDIRNAYSDSDLTVDDHATIEESPVTLSDLVAWNNEYLKVYGSSWYLYHRDIDFTIDDIIANTKERPAKKQKKKKSK